jgi:curli biogenesis system outer membrane secretion channel CsgG
MKKILVAGSILMLGVMVAGCRTLKQITQPAVKADLNITSAVLPAYTGLKARIAIADFDVRAAKATFQIGSDLREMLIPALANSSRFNVVERQVAAIGTQEATTPSLGVSQPAGSLEKNKIKTADLIIAAAVTEFEPHASGGRAGVGGGGGVGNGILGGLLGASLNKAHIALDIRIVDATTSQVVVSGRVQGQASDLAGGFTAGSLGNSELGAGVSAYANTPMEKAIRICLIEAIRYIAQAIPAAYYKY